MSDLGKFIGGFGEGFVKTLESERKRKKEEDQFNQDMAFKYRQQNLMNNIYQQRQDLDKETSFVDVGKDDVYSKLGVPEGKYHTSLMDNLIGAYGKGEPKDKLFDIEGSYKNDKTGTYWTYDKQTGKPIDLEIPFDRNEGRTTVNMPPTQEPYVPTKDLDAMWRKYQQYDEIDKNWKNLSDENKKDKDGNVMDYKTFQKSKQEFFKEIVSETKDRAKKLSEEYVGFNSMFNDLLRDPALKTAEDKDTFISKAMYGYPEEAIRQMKELVYKRIF